MMKVNSSFCSTQVKDADIRLISSSSDLPSPACKSAGPRLQCALVLTCRLAGASITLCLVFPKFVTSVKNQGATFEVMERLHFFAEMNQIRTVFRCIYAVAFVSESKLDCTGKG